MTHPPALRPAPAPVEATRAGAARRLPAKLIIVVAVVLLAQMAVAMITTAAQQTPTIDEPVYVGTAAVYLEQHSLRYNPEHPPLGKLIIAAGLAVDPPRLGPVTGTQGEVGAHLLYGSGHDPWRLMLQARLPMILLTLLFGLVVLAFGTDLAGRVGGIVGLSLYAFSPDVIAHGSLATLDVPAAGFLLTSVWLLWRARVRPWRHLPLAALALGAALATRMSALPAVPVLLGLVVLTVWHAGRAEGSPRTARLLGAGAAAAIGVGLVAVAVVWASYLAVDPRLAWTPPPDVPVVGGRRGLLVDWMPFPEPYRDGMRVQFGFEDATFTGFLFGQQYQGSLWYYLPAALLIKTPLGTLVLWLAGVAAVLGVRRLRPAAPYVLLPPAVLLASVLGESRNFGTRYAIVLPVFLAVAAAAVVVVRRRWVPVVVAALVAFVAVSSLRTFPYYLPYANEAFGGPPATHTLLHDSNVDWGQDLGRLAERLRERYPGEEVWLVYKGAGVPSAYGIEAGDPRQVAPDEVRGLLAVSNSSIAKADERLAGLIASSTRIDGVGHSITIFRR